MRDSRRSSDPQPDDARFDAAAAPPGFELAAVVDRFQTPLLRYVGQILGPDSGEVEEVVEDTFLRFHRQVSRYGHASISNLASWLFRVSHNLARDAGRRRKRRKKLQDDVMSDPTLQTTCTGRAEAPGVELARREAYELAMAELRRLPDAEQNILLLKLIQGLTLREISEVTGIRLSTVHYRLNRGLQSLSGRLSELGLV
ncbi:MAG: sigma-70 family RNA polymerase sigma factor [Kiritimatiellaeota bacterium]|nr:sigma-70 family RNA polymerase sigma factor [Kiritimatiellota bacterium]